MRRRVRWTLLGLLCLVVAGCFVPVDYQRFTCVICRLYRLTTNYASVPITREYDNECSRWYAARVEPKHDHVWERSTCVYLRNLWGVPTGVGCRPGHYPIWILSPKDQMTVYQHFKNPLEAKQLFANLTDEKTYNDRLDGDDHNRGELTVDAILEWSLADFPGTWAEWWNSWYAKHVEDRQKQKRARQA